MPPNQSSSPHLPPFSRLRCTWNSAASSPRRSFWKKWELVQQKLMNVSYLERFPWKVSENVHKWPTHLAAHSNEPDSATLFDRKAPCSAVCVLLVRSVTLLLVFCQFFALRLVLCFGQSPASFTLLHSSTSVSNAILLPPSLLRCPYLAHRHTIRPLQRHH